VTGKGARTRERILDTAAVLFHQRGINATSLGDVLRASNTGKGQFYQHFAGRDELVNRVLERNGQVVRSATTPIETWHDLRSWMEGYARRQQESGYLLGCPIGTAAYALQPQQEAPRRTIEGIFDGMRDQLSAFFRREHRAGRLAREARPRALADFAIAAVQGALILGLVERGRRPVRAVIDEAYAHLASYATSPDDDSVRRTGPGVAPPG
jgi:TetR/AcrR family transcriptional regulator, transcriptional repressor for nem operon